MAAPKVSDLDLATYLKLVSKGAVMQQLSQDHAGWLLIKQLKKGPAEGRTLRKAMVAGEGSDAIGFIAASRAAYHSAHKIAPTEAVYEYKDFAATVEVENALMQKVLGSKDGFAQYGEPLAAEINAKMVGLKRILAKSVFGDGTGVLAQVASAAVTSARTVVTVDVGDSARGYIANLRETDRVLPKNADGTAAAPTVFSGTFSYYQVYSVDRSAGTVTLQARDASDAVLTVTATGLTAGDLLYPRNLNTISDLSSVVVDYNTLSESLVGLESMAAADGRLVNGITMSGALSGTHKDLAGSPLTSAAFQQILSMVKDRVGPSTYQYKSALMNYKTYDHLVDVAATDRRFITAKDAQLGVDGRLAYAHGRDQVMLQEDEFCPEQRIWILPTGNSPAGDAPLEWYGSDIEAVNLDGVSHFAALHTTAGRYARAVNLFFEGTGSLVCNHPASIGLVRDFAIS